jgi:hypothetical protein
LLVVVLHAVSLFQYILLLSPPFYLLNDMIYHHKNMCLWDIWGAVKIEMWQVGVYHLYQVFPVEFKFVKIPHTNTVYCNYIWTTPSIMITTVKKTILIHENMAVDINNGPRMYSEKSQKVRALFVCVCVLQTLSGVDF